VRYTNQEGVALDEIFFHLYPNLLGGASTVAEMTVNGEPAAPEYQFQESILGVPLDRPLAPGGQVVIGLTFDVQVPEEGGSNYGVLVSREGVLALAHFFPQAAVYDDEGWNILPPAENADPTYADAAFYLARIVAPAEQVVVTSGSTIEQRAGDGTQTLTVAAGPARDFYLASSADYQVTSAQSGKTTINSYGFAEHQQQNEQVLAYAAAALQALEARYGLYPYRELDVLPTPNLALGVEYPGVIVLNTRLYDPAEDFGGTPSAVYLESTVAHEAGHQWFYNLVGNDQLDEPWLDESLTQYATYLYFVDEHGGPPADAFRQALLGRWQRVEQADMPIGLPAGAYDGQEYSGIIYGRGAFFFEALAEAMGQPAFDAFLRDYATRHRWQIATAATLQATAEENCACDLDELFAEWVTAE
jgi:aminopeptidase N